MALNTALYARARYFVDVLTPLLPPIQLRVYMLSKATDQEPDLYLLGFILSDILLGGYTLPPPLVPADCGLTVLRASAFFMDSWKEGSPRFYPETMRLLYETHLQRVDFWQRLV